MFLCNGFYVNPCINNVSSLNTTKDNFIRLPNNVSDLNDYMCGPMNTQGPMCSQCVNGFGLVVFSIGHPCTNCTGVWCGVPLYLFMEFVPITSFYFIIMFFILMLPQLQWWSLYSTVKLLCQHSLILATN